MTNTDFTKLMKDSFGELSFSQLWALTKFAKNVRLRCRNNSAFNNFMNRTFPYATFKQVEKTRPDRFNPAVITTYFGLDITVKGETRAVEDEE